MPKRLKKKEIHRASIPVINIVCITIIITILAYYCIELMNKHICQTPMTQALGGLKDFSIQKKKYSDDDILGCLFSR